jgi:hypothetical protein
VTSIRLKYVQAFGGYYYFRRRGYPRVRLPGLPGSPEFMAAYQAAQADKPLSIGEDRSIPGSVSAAIAEFYMSSEWAGFSNGTKQMRRAILERFRNRFGRLPVREMESQHLEKYLAKLKPHAAKNALKTLRGLLEHARHDVSWGLRLPKAKSTKHPSWPVEVIAQYEAHHRIGTKARLCLALAKYTRAGRAEIARLGPQQTVNSAFHRARRPALRPS